MVGLAGEGGQPLVGQVKGLMGWWISDAGIKPDMVAFGAAMHACRLSGEWAAARRLFDRIEVEGLKYTTGVSE